MLLLKFHIKKLHKGFRRPNSHSSVRLGVRDPAHLPYFVNIHNIRIRSVRTISRALFRPTSTYWERENNLACPILTKEHLLEAWEQSRVPYFN